MPINYEKIGEYACEKAEEYEISLNVYSGIVNARKEIDKKIQDAEVKGNKNLLPDLYDEYRKIREDQRANESFRQKFCEDFLSEISQMMEENNE